MWLADGQQMQDIDRRAISLGIPGQLLMEAASSFAARIAADFFEPLGPIVVVAGGGNNGGDGWGIARHLAARNLPVRVVTAVDPEELQGDAAVQFRIFDRYGLAWDKYNSNSQLNCALLVDALLGTGLRGAARGLAAAIISGINASPAPVLAVDIPSGLPGGSISAEGEVVQATATATFGLVKAGLYTPVGRKAAGRIFVDPIGLPAQLLRDTGLILNDAVNARLGLPGRSLDSHKGSYGHGLLVAGSRGMSGAALLAGSSALRSGIGLLTVACPENINPLVQGNLWEALTLPLLETEQGVFSAQAAAQVDLSKFKAAAVGPGCRVCAGTKALVDLLVKSQLPLVIDADGLNSLAPNIPCRDYPTVISPHPGEMARLLDIKIDNIIADPLETCRRAAGKWGCTVVLKGATTYIAGADGASAVNITGTNGLATGGSGDILTGLILGLLAQGVDPLAAACTSTWLLGTASELAADKVGTAAQLPRDVLNHLPGAISQLADIST